MKLLNISEEGLGKPRVFQKKIFALLVLSLFLISMIPATFAESDTAKTRRATDANPALISADTGKSDEAPGTAVSACMQRLLKARPNVLKDHAQQICVKTLRLQKARVEKAEKLEDLKDKPSFEKYNENLDFKARAIDKIKIEKAKANFLKAKENFENARERHQEAKDKFSEAKKRIDECEESETEECQERRENIKEHAKDNLIAIADRILEHLNKLKSNVEANEDLSEEEAAEIIAKIDEQIQEVEDAKTTIETSESKDEIIESARTLNKVWKRVKEHAKIHAARTVNARIGGIIVKSKQLEIKLEKTLERMTESGKDTSVVEPLIEEFNAKLEDAKTNYEAAVGKFKEAKETEEPDKELIKEGQAYMKDAHKALQDAQKTLRDILKAIKTSGGEKELEETEDEAEDEEDDTCVENSDCDDGEVCDNGECEDIEEDEEESDDDEDDAAEN